jgi:hypothetical protein
MAQAIPLRVSSLAPTKPTPVISTEGGAFAAVVEKSAVAVAFVVVVAVVCSPSPNPNPVISTEGGALAAVVEKSAVCRFLIELTLRPLIQLHRPLPRQRQILPGRIFPLNQSHLLLPPPSFDLFLPSNSSRSGRKPFKPNQPMTIIALGKPLKPTFPMLYNPRSQIAGEPHIQHTTTISNKVDIEHLFNISTHRPR